MERNGINLYLDCEAIKSGFIAVYKIPMGVSFPTKLELIYSIGYAILVFALPLVYKHKQNVYYLIAMLVVSIILAILVLKEHERRVDKDYSEWVSFKDHIGIKENSDLIIDTYCIHILKNSFACIIVTVLIILFLSLSCFFSYYYKVLDYKLLLALNAPSELVLFWGLLKPLKTLKYYMIIRQIIE